MAATNPKAAQARPGDTLLVIRKLCFRSVLCNAINIDTSVIPDDFTARSPDELTLVRGDRIELIERDDDFGDGWFLGKHLGNGTTGLFPEGTPCLLLQALPHPDPSRL